MKRMGKMLAVILGAGLLVVAGAIFGPRTAHALAATFVQVVNTPETVIPVVQGPASSMLYSNTCTAKFPASGPAVCSFPDIPSGKTLVAESLSIFFTPPNGSPSYTITPIAAFFARPSPCEDLLCYLPAARIFIPLAPQALNGYVGASAARVYFHVAPVCVVGTDTVTQGNQIYCTLGGYLVPTN